MSGHVALGLKVGTVMSLGDLVSATHRVVTEIEVAGSGDQVTESAAVFARMFGFLEIMIFILPMVGEPAGSENILGASSPDVTACLLDDAIVFEDSVIAMVRKRSATVTWNGGSEFENAPGNNSVFRDRLATCGWDGGMIVPAFGASGLTGLVLMVGKDIRTNDETISFLKLLAVYCFDRSCSLQRAAIRDRYGLTMREFECMKWVAAGKTDWEIGQILSISPKTVNYHVENAKRKMEVPTRVQAVVAAILSGGVQP